MNIGFLLGAYALMLAERGATVVVNDLGGSIAGRGQDKTVADRVVAEIRVKGGKATPSYVSAVEGDKIVEQAMREFGRVDIIINNAGIGRTKPFENYRDEDWDMVYQTHLGSAWKINKAAWAIMQKQKYGRIINVSSPTGYYGMTTGELASYTAAKAAMHGFTLTLAREGAKYNIKVCSEQRIGSIDC